MDNFKTIYQILKILEKAMDVEEMDLKAIQAEALGITENRWRSIMEMLIENGYVLGASIVKSIGGTGVKLNSDTRITLKGLEYLNENSFMKKAANIAKGFAELLP